jgi:hypothetical protein
MPLILALLVASCSSLTRTDNFVVSMDRANWKFGRTNINIFMIAIYCKRIAYAILLR